MFAVSDSLRQVALGLGVAAEQVRSSATASTCERFIPSTAREARRARPAADAPVLVTVGGLVERKGFHRVIELPAGAAPAHPEPASTSSSAAPAPKATWRRSCKPRWRELGLAERVHFLGALPPDELRVPLSAADVFVLATRNEGWANVFLEAMACGLPVVTTDVGGNAEVVVPARLARSCRSAIASALAAALPTRCWHDLGRAAHPPVRRGQRLGLRVDVLVAEFRALCRGRARQAPAPCRQPSP